MASQPDQPSMEERARMQQQSSEHSTGLSAAASGQGQGFDPSDLTASEFVERWDSLNVDEARRETYDEDDGAIHNLEAFFSAESSRHLSFGNISRDYWGKMRKMDKANAILAKMQLRRQTGVGSACTGATRRRMLGDPDAEAPPPRTADLERQIDAAVESITMKRSGSVGGWLLSKIADMSVVTRSENLDSESSGKSGILSRITSGLRGS